jgi:hypothetical protein
MDSERIFPASAIPIFGDEIPHKLFFSGLADTKVPTFPIVGTALG